MSAKPQQHEATIAAAPPAASVPRGPGLRERAVSQRRRQNRLAIALLTVLTVGALAVYVPQQQSIADTRIELARTESELASNQARAVMLPQLVAAVSSLRRQVDQYKPLRGREDIERAMHEISTINNSTQLTNYKYDMDVEHLRPLCREQPLKITFQADFVDAMSFIQKLEAMDRLTRLRELSIQKADLPGPAGKNGGNVAVSMSLSLFFDPSEEGK